jgi:pantoate--beta-alanine ligase
VGEVMGAFGLAPEYAALVDPDTLAPVQELSKEALLLAAVRVGAVRLIDNTTLGPRPAHSIHMDGVATALA